MRVLEERETRLCAVPLSRAHLPWRIVLHAALHPRDPSFERDATTTRCDRKG